MSAKKRNSIKEYLHGGFTASGNFSRIEEGRTPLDTYRSPEAGRFLALWRDDERFLVAVHADTGYKEGLDAFSTVMKDMAKAGIACASVFDDAVFYQWDAGIFKSSRTGTRTEKAQRIKLRGLERVLQPFGPITYYKNRTPHLEVVNFTGGVVADYSQSRIDFAREQIKDRELLTVMDARVIGTYTSPFELSSGKKQGYFFLASFRNPEEHVSLRDLRDSEKLDDRGRFLFDELDGGRDFDGELTADELRILNR